MYEEVGVAWRLYTTEAVGGDMDKVGVFTGLTLETRGSKEPTAELPFILTMSATVSCVALVGGEAEEEEEEKEEEVVGGEGTGRCREGEEDAGRE